MTLVHDAASVPAHPELGDADWAAAVGVLLGAGADGSNGRVALVAHVSPDGDALGSALALGIALKRMGIDVVVSHDTAPFRTPPSLLFLPGQELLVPPSEVGEVSVLAAFDTGSADRLGVLGELASSVTATVVVDHHVTNTRFGTHNLIDVTAASTTVLVTRLLDAMGATIDAEIATCLYTGLVTDTGSFKYAATTPDVHLLAARLLETGIRHDLIAREVYDSAKFGYVQLLGDVLSRVQLDQGLGLVWTSISNDDLTRHGLSLDEVEGVIDVVRLTVEAEVAAVVKQDATGAWKVSMRSKGGVDVGHICESLGGGGHLYAAGYTSSLGADDTVEQVKTALAAARA